MKSLLGVCLILIIGGIGGVLADQVLLPYLSTVPLFFDIEFIRQNSSGITIINSTEKVHVTENTAISDAVDEVGSCLVVIQSYWNKKLISQGTGFIVTSDGLIMTSGDLVSTGVDQYLIFRDDRSFAARLIDRDLENNLALFKIAKTNLPVVSLVDFDDLRLGGTVILVGAELAENGLNYFINTGMVRSINQNVLKLNLEENHLLANGSPLVNIKGEVVGLNLIGRQGLIQTIPVTKIREFLNL